jgi:hypothetical protein
MASWGNIGAAIYSLLNTGDTLTIYGGRIVPNKARFNTTTYPIIVYTITDTEPTNTKGANGDSKLDVLQVQIAIFHKDYSDLIDGQDKVRAALDYVTPGNYPSTGSNKVKLQSCSFQDMRQDFIEDFDEQGLYVSYMNYQFRQQRG